METSRNLDLLLPASSIETLRQAFIECKRSKAGYRSAVATVINENKIESIEHLERFRNQITEIINEYEFSEPELLILRSSTSLSRSLSPVESAHRRTLQKKQSHKWRSFVNIAFNQVN
jgi:hypothetical protein